MLCTRRCAKSVACRSEKVIGVSDIFFLPFFVIVFTNSATDGIDLVSYEVVDRPGAPALPVKRGHVRLEGVHFGYEPGRRYPLIVAIHGGPASADLLSFNGGYGSQVYAGEGYVVLKPNYRGSTNYGEAHKTAIRSYLTVGAPDVCFWFSGNRMKAFVERGLFDGLFLADVLGVYDVYGGSQDAAVE